MGIPLARLPKFIPVQYLAGLQRLLVKMFLGRCRFSHEPSAPFPESADDTWQKRRRGSSVGGSNACITHLNAPPLDNEARATVNAAALLSSRDSSHRRKVILVAMTDWVDLTMLSSLFSLAPRFSLRAVSGEIRRPVCTSTSW